MQSTTRKVARGFTLIELLVVIVIISILAAILFPVFAKARENARRASCMSNLKQIGLGIIMYTQDYDEMYPPNGITVPANTPGPDSQVWGSGVWFWQQLIYPYTKSDQVYYCPSGTVTGNFPYVGEYGANWYMLDPPVSLASVQSVASTYMIMDSGSYLMLPSCVYAPTAGSSYYLPGTGPLNPPTPAPDSSYTFDYQNGRHLGGVNMCYANGHVKWQQSSAVYQQAQNYASGAKNAWDPANPD